MFLWLNACAAGATRGQILGKGDEAIADERKVKRKYGKLASNELSAAAIEVDDVF